MKSLEARFRDIEIKNPLWSTFVVFVAAINDAGFTEETIRKWFPKLVDRGDYSRMERIQLMQWVVKNSVPKK